MNLQPSGQAPRFSRRKRLIQARQSMRIQVAHDQHDGLCIRIMRVEHLPNAECPVDLRAALTREHDAAGGQPAARRR